jgi:predicted RNA-binding protein with PUA-like domain
MDSSTAAECAEIRKKLGGIKYTASRTGSDAFERFTGPQIRKFFKTEPDAYSFDDFLRDKETVWDGVTNPTAVKHLRELKKGTKWIFYHTGDERTAVGTGTVVSVDPTDPKVPIVKVKVGKRLKTPRTLDAVKAEPLFRDSPLVKIGRLSVVPLTEDQWHWFTD